MALSSRLKNRLMDAINVAFGDVGATPDTRPPKTKDNRGPLAWEYFVADHLAKIAKARLAKAKAAAIKAGILFDHEKFPRKPGDNGLVFTGEQVGVFLTVKTPGKRIDTDKLYEALIARNVSERILNEAYEYAEYFTKPAHEFRPTLVVNDNATGK